MRSWRLGTILGVIMLFSANLIAEIRYQVVDLGPPGMQSCARYMNDNGQIVGSATLGPSTYAAVFDATGAGYTLLGIGEAYCINNESQIVGGSLGNAVLYNPLGPAHPSAWNMVVLGQGEARGINDSGQIVGWSGSGPYDLGTHAALFDATGAGNNTNLDEFYDYVSYALGINQVGQVLIHEFDLIVDSDARLFDIGSGEREFLYNGTPLAINDTGQIVGVEVVTEWYTNPWGEPAFTMETYGVLCDSSAGGDTVRLSGWPYSINDIGQIVGERDYCAALLDATGSGMDILLNNIIDPASGWDLRHAYSINNNGWIVGAGINPAGYEHAFLLIPIPEPATLALLGIGVAILSRTRRRRQCSSDLLG